MSQSATPVIRRLHRQTVNERTFNRRWQSPTPQDRLVVLAAKMTGATVRRIEAETGVSKSVVSRICRAYSRQEWADALALYQLAYEDAKAYRLRQIITGRPLAIAAAE